MYRSLPWYWVRWPAAASDGFLPKYRRCPSSTLLLPRLSLCAVLSLLLWCVLCSCWRLWWWRCVHVHAVHSLACHHGTPYPQQSLVISCYCPWFFVLVNGQAWSTHFCTRRSDGVAAWPLEYGLCPSHDIHVTITIPDSPVCRDTSRSIFSNIISVIFRPSLIRASTLFCKFSRLPSDRFMMTSLLLYAVADCRCSVEAGAILASQDSKRRSRSSRLPSLLEHRIFALWAQEVVFRRTVYVCPCLFLFVSFYCPSLL